MCQKDIREFQLAVGAIRAGVNILLKMEGIKPSDLDAVLLAGAFGNFIRRASAVRTGIIPDIDHDRVNFVGNTASLGAKLALVSDAGKELAEKAGRAAKHIDLSKDPSFHDEFCDAMIFPVIDVSKV